MNLLGKTAIVTGAGSLRGIGRGIALALADAGADLVLVDRCIGAEAEKNAEDIRKKDRRALLIQADLSKNSEVESVFTKTVETFGKVDIMVNNAGVCVWENLVDVTKCGFDAMVNVNLKGTFECCRQAAQSMIDLGVKGRIVNVASVQSKRPTPAMSVYAATKAGIDHFTQSLAMELAGYGITVNQVWPGFVDTSINGAKPELSTAAAKKIWLETIPLGQVVVPDDLGKAVVYLCGESAQVVTGAVIKVDGGAFIRCLQ